MMKKKKKTSLKTDDSILCSIYFKNTYLIFCLFGDTDTKLGYSVMFSTFKICVQVALNANIAAAGNKDLSSLIHLNNLLKASSSFLSTAPLKHKIYTCRHTHYTPKDIYI